MSSTNFIDSRNFNFTCDMEACLNTFDKDRDGCLNIEEFEGLCEALFRNEKGEAYKTDEQFIKDTFSIFDQDSDGLINKEEFSFCWNNWIKTIVRPVSAILIIDVQNDFISGTLDIRNCPAKQNGEDVILPINDLLENVNFDAVFYSYDWHPKDHVSFIENLRLRKLHSSSPVKAESAKVYDTVIFEGNPPMIQRLWPKHCVQNTWGSELHKNLKVLENAVKIYKGTNPEVDSYSAFWDNNKLTDTTLATQLRNRLVTDVYVCGVAYDVCVGATAFDAITSGFRTALLDDCSRGVDLLDIEKTKEKIIKNHGIIVNSSDVENLVKGADRRPELGYKLALELKKANHL